MRILLLLAVLPLVWAQFPAACNKDENTSLLRYIYCPNGCSSHGLCMNITEEVVRAWMSDQVDSKVVGIVCDGNHGQNWLLDVRCRWPKMFEMFCCCDLRVGEDMTAANATLDTLTMELVNAWNKMPISSW